MASNSLTRIWKLSSILTSSVKPSGYSSVPCRTAMYPSNYMDPVLDKDIEIAEDLRFHPVKATPNDVTTSILYDPLVSKFVNVIMRKGEKQIARNIVEKAFEILKRKQISKYNEASADGGRHIEMNPFTIFHTAMQNMEPLLGLHTVKRGGRAYQVPTPLSANRQRFLAMKWLVMECKIKPEMSVKMEQRVAEELLKAFSNEGNVIAKKQNLHRQCEANRAYAHYRWW